MPQLGALDYISKPVVMEEVRARVDKALEKRQLVLQNRFYQKNLESRVRELDRRNKESLINGVQTLVHALEAKDAYTSGHSSRVSRYAVKTAVHLGYVGELLEHIRLGAELHDIGKIGTREAILNKPGPLTPEEFEHIKEHTALGEKILAPFLNESPMVLRIVRSHHERMDGVRFSRRSQRRPDPAGGPHRRGGGRLRCDDHEPRLPAPSDPDRGLRRAAPLRGRALRSRGRGRVHYRVSRRHRAPHRPLSGTRHPCPTPS